MAGEWAESWGQLAAPVWQVVTEIALVGPGAGVLDVGCGAGDLLLHLDGMGARTAGLDPAPAMAAIARARVPAADIRLGSADDLPWPDGTFDLTISVNALHFAPDPGSALLEMSRVTAVGGLLAVANWADAERNDIDAVEDAVARAAGAEIRPGGPERDAGGLEDLFRRCRLEVLISGVVAAPWTAADDGALVRALTIGETTAGAAAHSSAILDAARPFRRRSGGYVLDNAFRYTVGRPAVPSS
ncbi:MAG: class I SAM-dependent methyltransferase [Phycicoccus sp.]